MKSQLNQFEKALKESEVFKQNDAFVRFINKMKRKYGNVSETEFLMLKDAFDFGIKYKEKVDGK